jgi:hypothetical protein
VRSTYSRGVAPFIGMDNASVGDVLHRIDHFGNQGGHLMTRAEGQTCQSTDRVEVSDRGFDRGSHPTLTRRHDISSLIPVSMPNSTPSGTCQFCGSCHASTPDSARCSHRAMSVAACRRTST